MEKVVLVCSRVERLFLVEKRHEVVTHHLFLEKDVHQVTKFAPAHGVMLERWLCDVDGLDVVDVRNVQGRNDLFRGKKCVVVDGARRRRLDLAETTTETRVVRMYRNVGRHREDARDVGKSVTLYATETAKVSS